MEPAVEKTYRKQERDKTDIQYITGTSVIIHKVRVELGLTMREYVILDFIHTWHSTKKSKITFGDIWKGTGVRIRMVENLYQRLKAKDLLFMDVDGKVKTTKNWNDKFNPDLLFEELWPMIKTGNKQVAKTQFKKCLKVDTFENIKNGLQNYIDFLKQVEWMAPQHLSTFLNPKKKEWQTLFDASIYQNKPKNQTRAAPKITTGPRSAFD